LATGATEECNVANNPGVDPDVAFLTGVAHRLALSLATLVVDQTLLSESDVPFEPFTLAFPVGQRVGAATLRDALAFDSTRTVDISPAAQFFERVVAAAQDGGDQRSVQVLAVLELLMRRSLGTLRQAFVRSDGVVAVPFFLFGRLAGGPLVGLRSTAIET
jgi:hypothetical protein